MLAPSVLLASEILERNVFLSRIVFAAPETAPVVSITAMCTSSNETPLSAANAEVPGRGPIAESFRPVEPIVVLVY